MERRVLIYVIDRLLPDGEVVIGIDDSIERRWGAKIQARGIYRDPVRADTVGKTDLGGVGQGSAGVAG